MKDLSIFIRANLWLVPVIAALIGAVFYYVAPPPPMTITISSGFPNGGYETFAKKLQAELETQGFELKIIPSSGSQQNTQRLLDPDSGVDIALLQSGQELTLTEEQRSKLFSLGAMYQEPLWLLVRKDVAIETMSDLKNLRVAIGSANGGISILVRPLLKASGIDLESLSENLVEYSGPRAAEDLLNNKLDAIFLMVPPENAFLQSFAANPEVRLFHFAHAEAFERHFPYISRLNVSRGLLNLANDIPHRDLTTLSSKALLVVNESFHPALTPLILASARKVMAQGTLLDDPNTWPIADSDAFPMLDEAEYFYSKGLPLLQRYLPFRIASLADRYIILLFPLLVILFPLFKIAGPVYRWRIRSRIYRWYKDLRNTERLMVKPHSTADLQAEIERLQEIQQDLIKVEVPLAFTHELYELHLHVRYVLQQLQTLQKDERHQHHKDLDPLP